MSQHTPGARHEISPSHAGVRKDVYVLLIVVAASMVGARILTAPHLFSVNDRSRWATVRALVETGSYSVGYREDNAEGTYRDVGIITQGGWESSDIVMDPATGRFYSSKPPLLPTLVAGEYWVLRHALNLDMTRRRLAVTRVILLTINLLPFLLYLLVFARLIERLGTTTWGRLFVFTAACFGTFVSGFLASLNNHTVAAMGVLFAVYHCLRIQMDDVAAYLLTQHLAVGSLVPTYARKSWYDFPGSYWLNAGGIDLADEHKLVYAANLLVGGIRGFCPSRPPLCLGG